MYDKYIKLLHSLHNQGLTSPPAWDINNRKTSHSGAGAFQKDFI